MKISIETWMLRMASQTYGQSIDERVARREPVDNVRQVIADFAELEMMDIWGSQMWEGVGNINSKTRGKARKDAGYFWIDNRQAI